MFLVVGPSKHFLLAPWVPSSVLGSKEHLVLR